MYVNERRSSSHVSTANESWVLIVTSHEMRLFSASVSPYLFRYIEDSIVMGSKWKRFDQIGATGKILSA